MPQLHTAIPLQTDNPDQCIFLESTQGKAVLRSSRGDPRGDIVSCSYAEILCMLLQGLPTKGTVSGIVILPQFPE